MWKIGEKSEPTLVVDVTCFRSSPWVLPFHGRVHSPCCMKAQIPSPQSPATTNCKYRWRPLSKGNHLFWYLPRWYLNCSVQISNPL
jgi:hypothetical protein